MSIVGELRARHRERLSGFPAPLDDLFADGLRALAPRLSSHQLQEWSETGVALTAINLRSWEAAAEFFRAATRLPDNTTWDALEQLGRDARAMASDSTPLATAFLRAAPDTIRIIGPGGVRQWSEIGRRLYKGNWKSSSLATQFFDESPAIFRVLRTGQVNRLGLFIDELARHSYELASACLASAPAVVERLPDEDRLPFLAYAVELAQTSWADTRIYLDRGVSLVEKIHAPLRERYLLLSAQVAKANNRSAFQYFERGALALAELEPDDHVKVIELGERIAPLSAHAAMDFVANVPAVLEKIGIMELEAWHTAGLQILRASPEGGEAYFRLESGRGEDILETLSARVELSRVGDVLRLYCKALTGMDVRVQPTAALAGKGIGWVDEHRSSTEGSTIFLPAVMEQYGNKEDNFAAVKVFATHQAAHIEFGSFQFRFQRPGAVFDTSRPAIASRGSTDTYTDMERFFDLFPDRALAHDIYEIAEDARIDAAIRREYGGIRSPLKRLQVSELGRRPDIRQLPLRQVFVENLLRASLDGADAVLWPRRGGDAMSRGLGVMERLAAPEAVVEDAAEATIRLYQLAAAIPNEQDEELDRESWDTVESMEDSNPLPFDPEDFGGEGDQFDLSDVADGEDYESPQEVDFRGDFKPELVQLLMKLKEDAKTGEAGKQGESLTPEQLRELLEKNPEIEIDSLMDGDIDHTTGMFLSNLMKEAGTPPTQKEDGPGDPSSDNSTGEGGDDEQLERVVKTFYYDEWDFRAQDYKPRWCAVHESTLEQGDPQFYEDTLREHAGLVTQTRKQFELMKPEMFRKIKRLQDGEDIDLDPAIEWMVEVRAGVSPNNKIFWRRNKIERDVAVAFLLDMSASTDEEIARGDRGSDGDDPQQYLSWWVSKRRQELSSPPKRIIDLEKEATVLLITALETIGDEYGIYGFSGYGRDNVEFFVIKDFQERFGDDIKERLDKITPIRSTRMGPALRHATHKLMQTDAKVKILVLLSDGRPQDHGYGRDRTEKEYAIHDTKQALNEAKREGITPFALTVDRAGHDYLKTMCEDMGYEVVADIEALPSRLPTLYRRLTE